MKAIDTIFALAGGEVIGLVAADFLKNLGVGINLLGVFAVCISFPLLTLLGLWLASLVAKKFLFVFQAAKHVLVGTLATVIDLKLFEFLAWMFSPAFYIGALVAKGTSFLIATTLKYFGNKYWTFQKYEKHNLHHEIIKLLIVDAVGLSINVGAFYFFIKIIGPQFSVSMANWAKLSVIFAALASAASNFLGYKFFVFKK